MSNAQIKPFSDVVPQVYAYTIPDYKPNEGCVKIGYTEGDVKKRIEQQTHTANIKPQLEWHGNAIYEGSNDTFTDKDFHGYLSRLGTERLDGTEWFRIDAQESKKRFYEFRENNGVVSAEAAGISSVPYRLRQEQQAAVNVTKDYFLNHENSGENKFLWNAKPRFGKTLCVYDLVKQLGVKLVLIVTNRPAAATSWYDDFEKFFAGQADKSDWRFVSENPNLAGRPLVVPQIKDLAEEFGDISVIIRFTSLQNLKGSRYFGGEYDKLGEIKDGKWDLLVLDEAHEGVDTQKTLEALKKINYRFALYLSGTPFKALAKGDFDDDAIFNWTYADEQKAKKDWQPDYISGNSDNPYEIMPRLNMFTYRMSDVLKDRLRVSLEKEDYENYFFDLNEFFSTDSKGKFVHNEDVNKFLDAVSREDPDTVFPYSTEELRQELCHTLWIFDRVDSAKAMEAKLKNHPVFKDYTIINVAGDGSKSEDEDADIKNAFDRVTGAIDKNSKTITLTVGRLTQGVTIPQWTGVLMLCNKKSPAEYMQAAFRAQNPYIVGKKRKENAYVFDFDPIRSLDIYQSFACDLCPKGASGTSEGRKQSVGELLNFFPVISSDEKGRMVEIDAERVMAIPVYLKSVEVVRRGFMSNFLFANISRIFNAPKAVADILNKLQPFKEKNIDLPDDPGKDLDIDAEGEINPNSKKVKSTVKDIFGPGKRSIGKNVLDTLGTGGKGKADPAKQIKEEIHKQFEDIADTVKKDSAYETSKYVNKDKIAGTLKKDADKQIDDQTKVYIEDGKKLEEQKTQELQNRDQSGKTEAQIEKETKERQKKLDKEYRKIIKNLAAELLKKAEITAVTIAEGQLQNGIKQDREDLTRDKLRGFSRTVPSFLMAFGKCTLAQLENNISDKEFEEVTSITKKEFRLLRDGGKITSGGKTTRFDGGLFDETVFNSAVEEFMKRKEELSDYFDPELEEDIFDYVPPQKTNQVFTPKKVVRHMVDLLEQENPGCFDDPKHTFLDPYMKSGQYIAEIVRRLYNSEGLKKAFPDKEERLGHIFAEQVFGLAPTEIIYNIARNYILGFDTKGIIKKDNIRHFDSLPSAKAGTLEKELDEIFR